MTDYTDRIAALPLMPKWPIRSQDVIQERDALRARLKLAVEALRQARHGCAYYSGIGASRDQNEFMKALADYDAVIAACEVKP